MGDGERSRYSISGELTNERFVSAVMERDAYPDGTAFLPSDAPDFTEMLTASVREHRPVAVIYPDGREVVATPAAGAVAVLLVSLTRWVSNRRQRRKVETPGGDRRDSLSVALPRDYQVEFREREPTAA